MKSFSTYQRIPGEPTTRRDEREEGSRFWNEGKWETFVKPLLPLNPNDMVLVDMGCNAGLFLKLAEDYGFSRTIGVDSDKTAIERGTRYRDRVGGTWELQRRRMERSVDKLPMADYTLLVNAHYYFNISDWLEYVDRLRSKTRYVIIVSGYKTILSHLAQAGKKDLDAYFKDWIKEEGIDDINDPDDPSPRRLFTQVYKSPLIERVNIHELDNGNRQQEGFYTQLDEDKLEKTDYYRRMKTYRLVEHGWSRGRFERFMREKAKLYFDVKNNGLMKPIVVKGDKIVDGNHRTEMWKHLGYKSIPCRMV